MSCSKDEAYEPDWYLNKWIGIYEGNARHWSSVQGSYHESFRNVIVNVQKSNLDSSLDFTITHKDWIVETKKNLKFSSSGNHSSNFGSGSSYGGLSVRFVSDSLYYSYAQKCGIPCWSGISFNIRKK